MPKPRLKLVAPASVNRTVPLRLKNKDLRTREHLTEKEVERLIKAAGDNRHGHRDATMVLIAFRHGLRASELCDLRWDQVDFAQAVLHVRRAKNGKPAVHPIRGDELRALREAASAIPRQRVRVHDGAGRAVHRRRRQPPDQAYRRACRIPISGPRPHAAPCLRLRAGQRRP